MTQEILRREKLKRELRAIFEQTLDERVERYLEVAHQGIIPNHQFAAASSECIDLYRDGYPPARSAGSGAAFEMRPSHEPER